MEVHVHCPVVLVKSGIGWIWVMHMDGQANINMGHFQGQYV